MKSRFCNVNNLFIVFLITFLSVNTKIYAGWVTTPVCRVPGPVNGCSCTTFSFNNPCVINVQLQPDGTSYDVQVIKLLTFGVDHSITTYFGTSKYYRINFDYKLFNKNGVQIGSTISESLTIFFNPFDKSLSYEDKSSLVIVDKAYSVEVSINTIEEDPGSSTWTILNSFPTHLYFEAEIRAERYYNILGLAPIVSTHIEQHYDGDNIPDELEITWAAENRFEEYELQWIFVNDIDFNPSLISDPDEPIENVTESFISPYSLFYNFSQNSNRVVLKEEGYRIPLLYDHGYILYRVRGIGRYVDIINDEFIDEEVYGIWDTDQWDYGLISNYSSANVYYFDNFHEKRKNWQSSTTFAEEGKRKDVISYYDGSLRNRQTVTRNNSDNNIIVGQTIYDHTGRGAVNVLPVPASTQSTLNFKYYPKFNNVFNSNTTAYGFMHFELDGSSDCETSVTPMGDNGANKYYSPDNPDKTGFKSYIPDAEGYPFSVVEYTPDNTGRIRRQGGVGDALNLDSGKEIKYLYGTANSIELDRMFGSEAGDAGHYKKNTVIDQNGQASITYINKDGKTIATSLAGNSPENLDSLAILNVVPPVAVATLKIDLFNEDYEGYSSVNIVDYTKGAIEFTSQITVAYSTEYTITYDLAIPQFEDSCLVEGICFDCFYDLEIFIKDECKEFVNNAHINITKVGVKPEINNVCVMLPYPYNITPSPELVVDLEPGVYTVTKILTLNEEAKKYYQEEYLKSENNANCLTPYSDILDSLVALLNFDNCSITCQMCVEALGPRDEFISSLQGTDVEYDLLYEACMDPCTPVNYCQSVYEMLLNDVRKGGQYGQIWNDQGQMTTHLFPLSVFNYYNILIPNKTGSDGNWQYPRIILNNNLYHYYINDDGTVAKIQLNCDDPAIYTPGPDDPAIQSGQTQSPFYENGSWWAYPQNLAEVKDFIFYWEENWAKSLIQYHPEYKYWEDCLTYAENKGPQYTYTSDKLDEIIQIKDNYADAAAAGLIDPSNALDLAINDRVNFITDDPFYQGAYNFTINLGNNQVYFNWGQQLQNKFINYITLNNTTYSMPQYAAIVARCGTSYGNPLPGACWDFGSGGTSQPEIDIRDKEWETLVALYLGEKMKLRKKRADVLAIHAANCPDEIPRQYNGCIGAKSMSTWIYNMLYNYSYYYYFNQIGNWWWYSIPYFQTWCQPCTYADFQLYRGKEKRFALPDDMLGPYPSMANNAEYQTYLQTGLCPLAFQFQTFIDALVIKDDLTSATPVNLLAYPEFSSGLYFNIFPLGQNIPTQQFYYQKISQLDTYGGPGSPAHLKSKVYNNYNITATIDLFAAQNITWSSIIKFKKLKFLNFNTVTNKYEFEAKVVIAGGTEIDITGNTTFELGECSFDFECDGTDFANDLVILMSALKQNNQLLTSVNPINSNTNFYSTYITSSFSNAFNVSTIPSGALSWDYTSNPLKFQINNSNNTVIILEFEPINFNLNNAIYFTNIKGNHANNFIMDAYSLNAQNEPVLLGTMKGKATLIDNNTNPVTKKGIVMGICDFPVTTNCNQKEQLVLNDLERLLKDVLTGQEITTNNNFNLFYSPYFTPLLQSYLSDVNVTATSSALNQVYQGYDLDFNFDCTCKLSLSLRDIPFNTPITILYLDNLVTVSSSNSANVYYDFEMNVTYDINGTVVPGKITGSSCWPIKDCIECPRREPERGVERFSANNNLQSDFIENKYEAYLRVVNNFNTRNNYEKHNIAYLEPMLFADFKINDDRIISEYENYLKTVGKTEGDSIMSIDEFQEFIEFDFESECWLKYQQYKEAYLTYEGVHWPAGNLDNVCPEFDPELFPMYSYFEFISYNLCCEEEGLAFVDAMIDTLVNILGCPPRIKYIKCGMDPCYVKYLEYIEVFNLFNEVNQISVFCPELLDNPLTFTNFIEQNLCCEIEGFTVIDDLISQLNAQITAQNGCPDEIPVVEPCEFDPCYELYLQYVAAFHAYYEVWNDDNGICETFNGQMYTYGDFLNYNLCCDPPGYQIIEEMIDQLNNHNDCPHSIFDYGITCEMEPCYYSYLEYLEALSQYQVAWLNDQNICLDLTIYPEVFQTLPITFDDFIEYGLCCSELNGHLYNDLIPVLISHNSCPVYDPDWENIGQECYDPCYKKYLEYFSAFKSYQYYWATHQSICTTFTNTYFTYDDFINNNLCCQQGGFTIIDQMIADLKAHNSCPPDITTLTACDQKCLNKYNTYVTAVNVFSTYSSNNQLGIALPEPVSQSVFVQNEYCDCVDFYVNFIYSIINGITLIPSVNSPGYGEFVHKIQYGINCSQFLPNPCDYEFEIPEPVSYEFIDPCWEQMMNIATANADYLYQEQLLNLTTQFNQNYSTTCLKKADEDLTAEYADKEYHFTLYYYDQAGNLIKTVPPEGVKLLDISSIEDDLAIQVEKDRFYHTQTVFTEHNLASFYKYNSLNQLVNQGMPDQDNLELWDFYETYGIFDKDFVVTSIQFINENKGYLTGYLGNRGYLYSTNDAGRTWQKVQDLVADEINEIVMIDNLYGYAIGDNCLLLKTVDGALTWDMVDLFGFLRAVYKLNDICYNADENELFIVGEEGILIKYDITGGTFSSNLYDSPIPEDNYTTVIYDASQLKYFIGGVKTTTNDGLIYTSPSNSPLFTLFNQANFTGLGLNSIHYYNLSCAFAGGNNGYLIKTCSSGSLWRIIKNNLSVGLNFKTIYFGDNDIGIALIENQNNQKNEIYFTTNGGSVWNLYENPTYPVEFSSLSFSEKGSNYVKQGIGVTTTGQLYRVLLNASSSNPNPGSVVGLATISPPGGNYTFHFQSASIAEEGNKLYILSYCIRTNSSLNVTELVPYITEIDQSGPLPYVTWNPLSAVQQVTGTTGHSFNTAISTNSGNYFGVIEVIPSGGNLEVRYVTPPGNVSTVPNPPGTMIECLISDGVANYFGKISNNVYKITPSAITSNSGQISQQVNDVGLRSTTVYIVGDNGLIGRLNGALGSLNEAESKKIRPAKINDMDISNDGSNNIMIGAVGNDGYIYKSNDGANFEIMDFSYCYEKQNLNAIQLDYSTNTSDFEGIIAGESGLFFRFFNDFGNVACMSYNLPNNHDIYDVTYDQVSTAVYLATDHGVYSTATGYSVMGYTPLITNSKINCVIPIPNTTTFGTIAAGDHSRMYQVGGSMILKINDVFPPKLTKVHFADINRGTFVGDNFLIRRTENGSLNWQTVMPEDNSFINIPVLRSVHTRPGGEAFAVGTRNYVGEIDISDNRIDNVLYLNNGLYDNRDISFINDVGYIVGRTGTSALFQKSLDGGDSWSEAILNSPPLNSLHQFSKNDIYGFVACGDGGSIYYFREFNQFTQSEADISYLATENLKDVFIHKDLKRGYAVGEQGTFIRFYYENAGEDITIGNTNLPNWITKSALTGVVTQNNMVDINAIAFSNQNYGVIGGDYLGSVTPAPPYVYRIQDEPTLFSSRFWYDKVGRLVLSQNVKQYETLNDPKRYSYTLYDELGRIKEVGEKTENVPVTPVPDPLLFKDIFGTMVGTTYNTDVIDETKFNTWISTMSGQRSEVTKTYYDEPLAAIKSQLPASFTYENTRNRVACTVYHTGYSEYELDESVYEFATHYSYDIHGNVKTLLQDNKKLETEHSVLADQRFKRIDYKYDLISGKVNEVHYQSGEHDAMHHRYEYDAENRLTEVYTSRYPKAVWTSNIDDHLWDREAKYSYYPHGPLARVELGTTSVQGLDYAYTLQGWIKGMNSSTVTSLRDMGHDGFGAGVYSNDHVARDAFGYTLNYFTDDYKPINAFYWSFIAKRFEADMTGSGLQNDAKSLFNGNIAWAVNTIRKPDLTATLPLGNAYKYDQLNRIVRSGSYNNVNNSTNIWINSLQNKYETTYSYDGNGNILTLNRDDESGTQFDELTYHYETDGNSRKVRNRLYHVNENASPLANGADLVGSTVLFVDDEFVNDNNDYAYDRLGNLVKDVQEDITDIVWTVSGKIKGIEKNSNPHLTFDYDPSGNRLAKHSWNNNFEDYSIYYIRDAQGNIMATYKLTYDLNTNPPQISYKLQEGNIYGSSRLGLLKSDLEMIATPAIDFGDFKMTRALDAKNYELTNHLGNVQAVVTARKEPIQAGTSGTISYFEPDIVTVNDYYPFGMPMPGRNYRWVWLKGPNWNSDPSDVIYSAVSDLQDPNTIAAEDRDYRYGFNGKENDDEVKGKGNWQDYGERYYDSRLGRFPNVDPIFGKFPMLSSYQFGSLNPIMNIDLDGLEGASSISYQIFKAGGITTSSARQIEENVKDGIVKAGRMSQDALIITGGILTIAVSGGAALPVAFGVVATGGGATKFIFDAQGKYDKSDATPTTISGMVMVTVNYTVGDEVFSQSFRSTVEFIEDVATLDLSNLKNPDVLKRSSEIMNLLNITIDATSIPGNMQDLLAPNTPTSQQENSSLAPPDASNVVMPNPSNETFKPLESQPQTEKKKTNN